VSLNHHRTLLQFVVNFNGGENIPSVQTEQHYEERENQQDATIRRLLSTSVSTCFGHHYAHLQENKDRVLLHMVFRAGSAGCDW
jgi:hypothetical protein